MAQKKLAEAARAALRLRVGYDGKPIAWQLGFDSAGDAMFGEGVRANAEAAAHKVHNSFSHRDVQIPQYVEGVLSYTSHSEARAMTEPTAAFRPTGHPLEEVTECPVCEAFPCSLPAYPGDYFDCESCGHSWPPTEQQKQLMWRGDDTYNPMGSRVNKHGDPI